MHRPIGRPPHPQSDCTFAYCGQVSAATIAEAEDMHAATPFTAPEGSTYAATMAWIERVVADSTRLRATRHEYYTLNGQLWVRVEGGNHEAHAWHVAVGGYAMPSNIDRHGVRRQMILGTRVHVEVVDDPRTRGKSPAEMATAEWVAHVERDERGGINAGIALIVGCVGLFLFGFTHPSRVPDGHWLLGMLIVGLVVMALVAFGRSYRRTERASAIYTEKVEGRTQQHQGSDHHQDGVA
ncbi:hypothetical protein [Kribbella sp. NPDC051718]|uniref:hypothetical protein n=1 Tax=Kribbella sp. NPDC051718 TaxID=3155168 RepID=UPI003430941E